MCVALEVEQAVAGFVNTHEDGAVFDLSQVNEYIMSLWNAGCGPVRLNFNQEDLRRFLESCRGKCLSKYHPRYRIDKSLLEPDVPLTTAERDCLHDNPDLIRSFVLFCRLRVDTDTEDHLLDAMGFRFMYRD